MFKALSAGDDVPSFALIKKRVSLLKPITGAPSLVVEDAS